MKTQRARRKCAAFSSTWTTGLKLGRVGKANIQTYLLRRCMLEGTRVRTYDYVLYFCMKRMRKFSISNMMTSDWGRFKGPPSASEWTFGTGLLEAQE